MKHEKYFTFDGSIEVWPVDEVHIAAMAHLTDKRLTHRRRIKQPDGSVLGLATFRSNKDEHLPLFEQLKVPGFTEILSGSAEEKHGKHSWDKFDAENAITRAEGLETHIANEELSMQTYVTELQAQKILFVMEKEQAVIAGNGQLIAELSKSINAIDHEINNADKRKLELADDRLKNQDEKNTAIAKKETAEAALLELGN